jgi:small subunit ribosomal protein S17
MARTLTGLVSSDKGDKTIVVAIRTRKTHPIYKKQYTVTTKFMAHDEKNVANEGDKVIIAECKPISARKRFTLVEVVEKAHVKLVDATVELPVKEKPVAKTAPVFAEVAAVVEKPAKAEPKAKAAQAKKPAAKKAEAK